MKRDSLSEMSAVCHVVSGRQRPQTPKFSMLVLRYRLGFKTSKGLIKQEYLEIYYKMFKVEQNELENHF